MPRAARDTGAARDSRVAVVLAFWDGFFGFSGRLFARPPLDLDFFLRESLTLF